MTKRETKLFLLKKKRSKSYERRNSSYSIRIPSVYIIVAVNISDVHCFLDKYNDYWFVFLSYGLTLFDSEFSDEYFTPKKHRMLLFFTFVFT